MGGEDGRGVSGRRERRGRVSGECEIPVSIKVRSVSKSVFSGFGNHPSDDSYHGLIRTDQKHYTR